MLSTLDQENLVHRHNTTAAQKPLNHNVFKTPFRPRHDENQPLQQVKPDKNASLVTPAPTAINRAPLGVKTTNAKTKALQTPAPLTQPKNDEKPQRPSTARRSVKRKIYVAPEPVVSQVESEEDEPEIQYAPPPIVPLDDPPFDFDGVEESFKCLKPENVHQILANEYFGSPKDENGFSVSLKMQWEDRGKTLDKELERLTKTEGGMFENPDKKVLEMIAAGPKHHAPFAREAAVSTIKARAAVDAISAQQTVRKPSRPKLPSVAMKETTASRMRKKDAITRTDTSETFHRPTPVSKTTIGFPRARKAPSILPADQGSQPRQQTIEPDPARISPKRFVELYGQAPVESDMWCRLMELEIRDRPRQDGAEHDQQVFSFPDHAALNQTSSLMNMDDDDFELVLDDSDQELR